MEFFGKRWVFILTLALYIIAIATGVVALDIQYTIIRANNGDAAALGMAALGIGIMLMLHIWMNLALFIRIHTTGRSKWWLVATLIPLVGIPFFLTGVLGDNEDSGEDHTFHKIKGAVEYKRMVGMGVGLVIAAGMFWGADLSWVLNKNRKDSANHHATALTIHANRQDSHKKGMPIPIPAPRNSCYDPSRVNTIGQAGWIGNCRGKLIVDNALLRKAASASVGGNEKFEIIGPDQKTYTFTKGRRTIFIGQVTNLSRIFYGTEFNGYIGHWDTSNVTDMSYTFAYATAFKRDIGAWNTSNLKLMEYTFQYAGAFNQNIGSWDVSKTSSMKGAFEYAASFNNGRAKRNINIASWYEKYSQRKKKTLEDWNTSNVVNMHRMFAHATAFNQPIGKWNVSMTRDMSYMFSHAKGFHQDIGAWNTSRTFTMAGMFEAAEQFNSNIGNWNTANVRDMSYMFRLARAFNQPIGKWSTPNLARTKGMFQGAAAFDQPIGAWNLSRVENTSEMFMDAYAFNQPIGRWTVSNVIDMSHMFHNAALFNQDISQWDTSMVKNMESMFEGASIFDQDLYAWTPQITTQPSRFSIGTPAPFNANSEKKPVLMGPEGLGTGARFIQ